MFFGVALLVAYSPDVWGTEKPMDMAFINAANASSSFPPHDPWMAGEDLNYYYLGHLVLAMVIRVAGVAPDHGYNLSIALIAALGAVAVFTLAGTLWAAARPRLPAVRGGPVAAGVAAVVVCLILGNLAGVREWLDAANPPGDYDWFAPSRVIPDTINEFPWFSILLGDLHAHLLAIPFTFAGARLRAPGRARRPARRRGLRGVAEALAAGLAVGALYAINTWSYPVAAGLLVLAVAIWLRDPRERGPARVRGRLVRARARGERRVRAAVPARVRPGGARDRLGRRAAVVRALHRRPGAALRPLRRAARGRLRRARARRPAAAARARVGRAWRRSSRSLLAAADLAGPAAIAALLAVALAALFSRAPRRARAVPLAAGRRRADRVLRPSSSTSATRSTAASCSA